LQNGTCKIIILTLFISATLCFSSCNKHEDNALKLLRPEQISLTVKFKNEKIHDTIILAFENKSYIDGNIIKPMPYAIKPKTPIPYWNYRPLSGDPNYNISFAGLYIELYTQGRKIARYDYFTLDPMQKREVKALKCNKGSTINVEIAMNDLYRCMWSGPSYRASDDFIDGTNEMYIIATLKFEDSNGKKMYEVYSAPFQFRSGFKLK